MNSPPEALIVHRTPARLRLKIPSRKGDCSFFAGMAKSLKELGGVDLVEANPITGSILFFSEDDPYAIVGRAERNGLIRVDSTGAVPRTLAQEVISSISRVNTGVLGLTAGRIDIPSMVFLVLFGLGIYQIGRGNFIAPAWYTAFWYASSIIAADYSREGAKPGDK